MKTYEVNTNMGNQRVKAEGFEFDDGVLFFHDDESDHVAVFKTWNYVITITDDTEPQE